jgi:hypothetical protein
MENTVSITSLKNTHAKCPRCKVMTKCWGNFAHTPQEIKDNPKLADEKLCQRCVDIILIQNPDHPSVPWIKLYQQKEKEYVKEHGTWIDSKDKVTLWEL